MEKQQQMPNYMLIEVHPKQDHRTNEEMHYHDHHIDNIYVYLPDADRNIDLLDFDKDYMLIHQRFVLRIEDRSINFH